MLLTWPASASANLRGTALRLGNIHLRLARRCSVFTFNSVAKILVTAPINVVVARTTINGVTAAPATEYVIARASIKGVTTGLALD